MVHLLDLPQDALSLIFVHLVHSELETHQGEEWHGARAVRAAQALALVHPRLADAFWESVERVDFAGHGSSGEITRFCKRIGMGLRGVRGARKLVELGSGHEDWTKGLKELGVSVLERADLEVLKKLPGSLEVLEVGFVSGLSGLWELRDGESLPSLKRLDLGSDGASVTGEKLSGLKGLVGQLEELSLKGVWGGNCLTFKHVFEGLSDRLKVLELVMCRALGDDALKVVGRRCKNLKRLVLKKLASVSADGFSEVVGGCDALEEVELEEIRGEPVVSDAVIMMMGFCCRNLRVIKLADLDLVGTLGLTQVLRTQPVVELEISRCRALDSDEALLAISEVAQLRVLKLRHMYWLSDTGIMALCALLGRKLQHLELCGCRALTDECFASIAFGCSALKSLLLYDSTSFTEKGIAVLRNNEHRKLATVKVEMCRHISQGYSNTFHFEYGPTTIDQMNNLPE